MKLRFSLCLFILLLPIPGFGQGNPAFNGKWTFIQQMSDDIGLYASLSIDFRQTASTVTILHKWGSGRSFLDSLALELGGTINKIP